MQDHQAPKTINCRSLSTMSTDWTGTAGDPRLPREGSSAGPSRKPDTKHAGERGRQRKSWLAVDHPRPLMPPTRPSASSPSSSESARSLIQRLTPPAAGRRRGCRHTDPLPPGAAAPFCSHQAAGADAREHQRETLWHQRARRECKDCGGSGICERQHIRITCKDCMGSPGSF